MKRCANLDQCPFFNETLPNMPTMAESIKRKYCLGEFEQCARLLVKNGGKPVPVDLFPNHGHRVAAILRS